MNQPNHEHNWVPVSLNDYNHGIGIARVVCMGCFSHSQVRLQHVPPLNPDFHLEHEPGGSEYIPLTKPMTQTGPHSRACTFHPHVHGTSCNANCPTCGGKPR